MLLSFALFTSGIIICLIVIRLWLNKLEAKSQTSDQIVEWLKDVGRRVELTNLTVDEKLTKSMELFAQLQRNIGEFSEIGRSMQELQDLLQSPKLRGNMGEQVLKELIIQYFPPNTYEFQSTF